MTAAVYARRALPFVGAGISNSAEYQGSDRYRPRTLNLTRRLANHLCKRARVCAATKSVLEGALGGTFKGAKKLMGLGLPWLAQQVVQLEPEEHQKLCEILDIKRFCRLQPTHAHRYLAYLAREGFLPEVISTNYDRCLEKAFRESIPAHPRPRPSPGEKVTARVVTDAQTNSQRLRDGRPSLTVYKINGCAKAYKDDAASARRIVLAELNLQDWHGEGWAKRLFKDRITQRALILSGFGGEEPQVRFAVAAVCDEFQALPAQIPPDQVPKQPNAPFVQERGPWLNRFQQQILFAWFAARTKRCERKKLSPQERLALVQGNAFTGEHRTFFRDQDSGLTADRFWEAVFMATWQRILKRELTRGVTAAFLTGLGLQTTELAAGVETALFQGGNDHCRRCSLLALDQGSAGKQVALPLFRCIEGVLRQRTADRDGPGRYVALRDEPLLLGLMLLFWAWCVGVADTGEDSAVGVDTDEELGLRLPRKHEGSAIETWMAGRRSPFLSRSPRQAKTDSRTFVQLALFIEGSLYLSPVPQSGAEPIRETRLCHEDRAFRRYGIRVDARLVLSLAAEELHQAGRSDWDAFCNAVDSIVDRPWRWIGDHRPSYRDRTTRLGGV